MCTAFLLQKVTTVFQLDFLIAFRITKFKHLTMLSKEKDEFSFLCWGFGQLVKHHLLRAGHNMLFPTWLSLTNASSSPHWGHSLWLSPVQMHRPSQQSNSSEKFLSFQIWHLLLWLLLWRAQLFWRVLIQKMSVQPCASHETQAVSSTWNCTQ